MQRSERADEAEIRLLAERVEWRYLEERLPDCVRVGWRDLLAGEVLCRRKVGPRGRIREEQALPDGVSQHLAERDNHIADRAGCLAARLELGDEAIDVLGAE